MRTFSVLLFLSCLLLIPVASLPADSDAKLVAMEKRLQVLEDREEIRNLILAYGNAHDNRDYRTFASLFARQGEWVGGMGSAKGPDDIFRLMDESIGHDPQPQGSGTYHILTNEQIQVEGDRASANTMWIYVTPGEDGGPNSVFLGHYLDAFIREDSAWKFLRREAPVNLPVAP